MKLEDKANIEFNVDTSGIGRVYLNGEDISRFVTSINVEMVAHEVPKISVTLIPRELRVKMDGVLVDVQNDIVSAFGALGIPWHEIKRVVNREYDDSDYLNGADEDDERIVLQWLEGYMPPEPNPEDDV